MAQLNARQRGAQNYWARKLESYRTYGAALERPQFNFRAYMLEKRKLNFGYIRRLQHNQQNILGFQLRMATLPQTPPLFNLEAVQLQDFRYLWVATDEQFNAMMADVEQQTEIALDLESNLEHAFFGMTCIIQLATYRRNYIIDPFSMFDNIRLRLKPILEGTACIKIVHGSANDVLALSKDFDVCIAGCIDTQHVHQQLLRVAMEDMQMEHLQNIRNHDYQEILWRSTQRENGHFKSIQDLALEATQMVSLTNLARLYLPNQPQPNQNATLADWRIREITNVNMQHYMVFDVFVLLKIWGKMKNLIAVQANADQILSNAVASTNALINRHFVPPPEQTIDNAIQQARVPPQSQPLFRVIFQWRNNYAKMVDEAATEILSVHEMNIIASSGMNTEAQIRRLLGQRRIPCESLDDWIGLLVSLTIRGETFWQELQQKVCHVCGTDGTNRHPHQHVAWGCVEPYSGAATREYLNNPVHEQERIQRSLRRRERFEEKHPGVPFPYGRGGR